MATFSNSERQMILLTREQLYERVLGRAHG